MWATTAALLAALKQDVEAHGARLSVLYVPARFEVNAPVWQTTRERYRLGKRWDPYVVFDRLRKELDAIGVPLLDPREALTRDRGGRPARVLHARRALERGRQPHRRGRAAALRGGAARLSRADALTRRPRGAARIRTTGAGG